MAQMTIGTADGWEAFDEAEAGAPARQAAALPLAGRARWTLTGMEVARDGHRSVPGDDSSAWVWDGPRTDDEGRRQFELTLSVAREGAPASEEPGTAQVRRYLGPAQATALRAALGVPGGVDVAGAAVRPYASDQVVRGRVRTRYLMSLQGDVVPRAPQRQAQAESPKPDAK